MLESEQPPGISGSYIESMLKSIKVSMELLQEEVSGMAETLESFCLNTIIKQEMT